MSLTWGSITPPHAAQLQRNLHVKAPWYVNLTIMAFPEQVGRYCSCLRAPSEVCLARPASAVTGSEGALQSRHAGQTWLADLPAHLSACRAPFCRWQLSLGARLGTCAAPAS